MNHPIFRYNKSIFFAVACIALCQCKAFPDPPPMETLYDETNLDQIISKERSNWKFYQGTDNRFHYIDSDQSWTKNRTGLRHNQDGWKFPKDQLKIIDAFPLGEKRGMMVNIRTGKVERPYPEKIIIESHTTGEKLEIPLNGRQ